MRAFHIACRRVHLHKKGGEGIRTPETLAGLSDFKSDTFNRSATPPRCGRILLAVSIMSKSMRE